MGDSVQKTCSRCGEEIVVMCAGEYLSSTDDELDFVLHVNDRDSRLAIRSEEGVYACPSCGYHDRVAVGTTSQCSARFRLPGI